MLERLSVLLPRSPRNTFLPPSTLSVDPFRAVPSSFWPALALTIMASPSVDHCTSQRTLVHVSKPQNLVRANITTHQISSQSGAPQSPTKKRILGRCSKYNNPTPAAARFAKTAGVVTPQGKRTRRTASSDAYNKYAQMPTDKAVSQYWPG
jgi:hypothetical protein